MADRSLGWVQNPSNTRTLQNVVSLLCPESKFADTYLNFRIPLIRKLGKLHDEDIWNDYISLLESGKRIPYAYLKGQGSDTESRTNALCSGIVQAAIDAQKEFPIVDLNGELTDIKKPYTDDWTSDGFIRWAIALGFIDYDAVSDTCGLTADGKQFIDAHSEQSFKEALGKAYLKYPPACRILELLSTGEHLTKFELGRRLGFTTEAGFTSFPQNIFVQAMVEYPTERKTIRSNSEGSSDKYARMICRWLRELGWVKCSRKEVVERAGSTVYSYKLQGYTITAKGLRAYRESKGMSSHKRVSKIVYYEMLATKCADKHFVRLRRANILQFIETRQRTLEQIAQHLTSKGIETDIPTIREDLAGLANIGLSVQLDDNGALLKDKIENLVIPSGSALPVKSEPLQIKEKVRLRINALNPKYLALIDLAFNGSANREFEIITIDLFTNELDFNGRHLGGARKPDSIVHDSSAGLIIDNKAYSTGYSMPISQVDEMVRYIQENTERTSLVNKNEWWNHFPETIIKFYFAFISSRFQGQTNSKLEGIMNRTGIKGACIDCENLLYIAEAMKRGVLSHDDFWQMFRNREVQNIEAVL
jgi:hypothetical protein